MSKFFCNGADADCSCPILCGDCKFADWTGGMEIKTNADHIRSMTDEELATLLSEVEYRRSIGGGGAIWFDDEIALMWLKQPYKEDT